MVNITEFRMELKIYEDAKNTIDKCRHKCIIEVTNACSHPIEYCRELEYRPSYSDFFSGSHPFIICTLCGYAEESWGCGHTKLKHAAYKQIPKILQEEFNKLVTRTLYQHKEGQKERIDRTY